MLNLLILPYFFPAQLEERGVEVSEDLYSKFQELLQSPPPSSDFSFKHYKAADDKFVTLKESTSIVSEGTTGLCSWQVSYRLSLFFSL